jgi:hypothetical protein
MAEAGEMLYIPGIGMISTISIHAPWCCRWTVSCVGVALAGDDQSLQKSVRTVGAAKAAGLESEPAGRIEQRPGRRIGEHHPRGAIHQHHAPGQALKPVRRRVMVEIAQPKLTMDTNGAVDVRQRGLEGERLLASYFIFPGALATQKFVETSFPTSKLAPIDAMPNSAGRIHSLKNGVATKSFRGIRLSSREGVAAA